MDTNWTPLIVIILALVVIAVIWGYSGKMRAILKILGISFEVEGSNHKERERPVASGEEISAKKDVNIKNTAGGNATGKKIRSGGDVTISTGSDDPNA